MIQFTTALIDECTAPVHSHAMMTQLLILHHYRLQAKLSCLDFSYSDPEKGFDRSKVNGLVAELINVPNASHCTALEVTAGLNRSVLPELLHFS